MQPQSDTLKIGSRLELGIGDEGVMWLPSRLEDHDERGRLSVAWPTDRERRLVSVTSGQTVEVATCAPRDALYAATAIVEEAHTGDVPVLRLRLNGPWQRSQRRNAVRTSVAVLPRIAETVYGSARRTVRLGVTNVSATGVRVRSQDELRRGDLLELAFELDGEVQVRARVQRVYHQEHVWEAGCEFEDISDSLAQRIVQFIFAQQRALLRARRGER